MKDINFGTNNAIIMIVGIIEDNIDYSELDYPDCRLTYLSIYSYIETFVLCKYF